MRRSRCAGFTLIEVLAVMLLTGIVFTVALDTYLDLSRASARATEHTRDIRRAMAILDRIAADFEQTLLVEKPPELDPLFHPWLFLGESRLGSDGADHLKFVTRHHEPRSSAARDADLAMVSYVVTAEADDTLTLWRAAQPHLPEALDREFPRELDATQILAEGLDRFAVLFQDDEGGWTEEWDSSTVERSSELPRAVEIVLALAEGDAEPRLWHRRVVLPVRPLDLQAIFEGRVLGTDGRGDDDGAGTGDSEEGDGDDATGGGSGSGKLVSVRDCVILSRLRDPNLRSQFSRIADQPFASFRHLFPVQFVRRGCQ